MKLTESDVPLEEADLVPLSLVASLVLKVKDGPSALGGGQVADKVVKAVRGGGLLDDDLGELGVEVEDDVLVLFADLEVLELLETFGVDTDSGRLQG